MLELFIVDTSDEAVPDGAVIEVDFEGAEIDPGETVREPSAEGIVVDEKSLLAGTEDEDVDCVRALVDKDKMTDGELDGA